jgi:hypothetical protein
MGDETKETELEHGNYDPLHATRKPSTADAVDEETPQVAQMPTEEEIERRHPDGERH